MRRILLTMAAVGATASAVLLGGCKTMDMTSATSAGTKVVQAYTISDQEIEQYVKQYIADLDAQNTICTGNDPYAVRLNRLVGKINNKNGLNIKVYKVKEVNAFATADGSIRIYSGLMDIMSDEEVLGVIGHEIGHVKLQHTKMAFKNALLTSAARDMITSSGGVVGNLTRSQLGDIGEAMMKSRFSQKQEYEADNFGYDFLKGAGINPWAMALSFDKLRNLQEKNGGQQGGAIMQLFSTHPDINARMAAMIKRAKADGYPAPAKFDN